MSVALGSTASRTRIRARPRRRSRMSRSRSGPGSSWCSPARPGRASPRCCGSPAGSCRTSTAAVRGGGDRWRGWTRASTVPASWPGAVGTLFQDPETQIVMGTVRAELALPLENRGEPRPSVARAVEEAALALGDRPSARPPHGRALRGRAPARGAGRGAGRPARGWSCSTSRPRSSTRRRRRADRPAAAARTRTATRRSCSAEHRLERCLASADRVIAMDGGRIGLRRHPGRSWPGRSAAAPELATPGARLLSRPRARSGAGCQGRAAAALRARRPAPGPAICRRGRRTRASGAAPAGGSAASEHALRVRPRLARARRTARRSCAASRCRFAPGERVALMGRNGAGKSTLLRHAAGLMQPTRGQRAQRGPGRAAAAEPDRLPGSRARRSRRPRRPRSSTVGLAIALRRPAPARPLGRREAAAGAGDRARRRRWRPTPGRRWSAWMSRRAAWTAPSRTSWPRCCASSTRP